MQACKLQRVNYVYMKARIRLTFDQNSFQHQQADGKRHT